MRDKFHNDNVQKATSIDDVAKFLIVLCMLFISSCLLFIGTYLIGLGFGFGQPNSISELFLNSFYPFFAVIPVVATQLWVAILYQNQSKALSLGIMMGVFILYAGDMPFWFIWQWPSLIFIDFPQLYMMMGVVVGTIFCFLGALYFQRKDVK
ncbi:hypothetical protein JF536_08785 [Priestia flexa]|uniref:hypothetical protein n=1 Tax=Priestia flexa TaxID=86664 RepID=UPI001A8E77BE|nr:hypothetical protein [Priestia flexa]MBN8434185.1 hypothetical protein [Priestia flexa]MCA0967031.1 ABC transporter permease [Priestia flexa]